MLTYLLIGNALVSWAQEADTPSGAQPSAVDMFADLKRPDQVRTDLKEIGELISHQKSENESLATAEKALKEQEKYITPAADALKKNFQNMPNEKSDIGHEIEDPFSFAPIFNFEVNSDQTPSQVLHAGRFTEGVKNEQEKLFNERVPKERNSLVQIDASIANTQEQIQADDIEIRKLNDELIGTENDSLDPSLDKENAQKQQEIANLDVKRLNDQASMEKFVADKDQLVLENEEIDKYNSRNGFIV